MADFNQAAQNVITAIEDLVSYIGDDRPPVSSDIVERLNMLDDYGVLGEFFYYFALDQSY